MEETENKSTRETQNRTAHGNDRTGSTLERHKRTAHERDIRDHHMEEAGESS
jgi:hypothetical protein